MPPRFSGVGGTWPVIDEVYDRSVIRQKSYLSCGSACGEMLLKSRGITHITQDEIEAIAGVPTWVQWLAESLNQLQNDVRGKWVGNSVSDSSLIGLNATGSWIAVMWEKGARMGHMVIIDGFEGDVLIVRDPWDGTRYGMTREGFLEYWNRQALY